MHNFT